MTMYKKKFTAAILMFFILADLSYGDRTGFEHGIATLSGSISENIPIKVRVCTAEYSPSLPYRGGWWGTESALPRLLVSDISVTIGKEKVFIPLSAYTDLADPEEVSLRFADKKIFVIILGGEAATSYQAELEFENKQLLRRRVFHREFCSESWEETVYFFKVGDR